MSRFVRIAVYLSVFAMLRLTAWEVPAGRNLLEAGADISGSGFEAKVDSINVALTTEHYFDKMYDRDPGSGWMPIDGKAPYSLEFRWRTPVAVNALEWDSIYIEEATLEVWAYDHFEPVTKVNSRTGMYRFPEVRGERFRIVIAKTGDRPAIFELALYGPAQLLVPAVLPEESSMTRSLLVRECKVEPEAVKPGDMVKVTWKVEGAQDGDWLLTGFRERMVARHRWWINDYLVTDAPVRIENGKAELSLQVPDYAPQGFTPLDVIAVSADDKALIKVENLPEPMPGITVSRNDLPPAPADFPTVKVGRKDGRQGFLINGEFYPPFFMHYAYQGGYERFWRVRDNGIKIMNVISTYGLVCPRDRWESHVLLLDSHIRNLLKVRPECYILLEFDLRAHVDWIKIHPEALMRDRDGVIVKDSYSIFGLPSMGSEEYIQEVEAFLDYALDFFAKQPYAGRIIGYQPWCCTALDAFQGGVENNDMVADRSKVKIGDFHPGAVAKFRDFLRTKYRNNVAELRKAWHRGDDLTFENAAPDAMNLAAEDVPHGVFRDPVKSRPEIDYAEFFPTMIGNLHRRLAAKIKAKTNHKALVMLHYGALLSNLRISQPSGRRLQSNNFDLPAMLEDDNIDMYVQAMPYEQRHSGQPPFYFQPIKSVTLHNRLYLADYDMRTYTAGMTVHGRHRSAKETDAIFSRDFADQMIRESGSWISDMSQRSWREWKAGQGNGRAWGIGEATMRATRETLAAFKDVPHESAAEIALVISSYTPFFEDINNASMLYQNIVMRMMDAEFPKIAAPQDVIMVSDLARTQGQYKLYVFLNVFALKPEEREAIEALKADGRTLAFFYAPGYVTENGLSAAAMSELLGVKIEERQGAELMQMNTAENSPLATAAGRTMTVRGFESIEHLHPSVLSPNFEIAPGAGEVVATWPDGKTAAAVKDFGTWKLFYSAVPMADAALLRALVRYAGVHLYAEEDLWMSGDREFLVWHNGYEAPRRIKVTLPRKCKVVNARTGKVLTPGATEVMLNLAQPDTQIWRLEEAEK